MPRWKPRLGMGCSVAVLTGLLAIGVVERAVALQNSPNRGAVIEGTVYDVKGNTVAKAEVWLTKIATGEVVAKMLSGKSGEFKFTSIPTGKYTLSAYRRDLGADKALLEVTGIKRFTMKLVLK